MAREALRRSGPLACRLESRLAQRDAGKARVASGWRPPWWKGVAEEALRKLVGEGLTFREVAARTGLQHATARKRIRALGLLGPGIGPARPKVTDAELLALRRAGLWAREITARTGLKGRSVRHRLWKLRRRGVGVPPPPAGATRLTPAPHLLGGGAGILLPEIC